MNSEYVGVVKHFLYFHNIPVVVLSFEKTIQ